MPSVFGKDNKKKELIKNLGQIYDQIQREQKISPGDFPDLKKMQECLAHHDFSKFNPLKLKLLEVVDKMLAEDIAKLMAMIPHEEVIKVSEPLIKGIIFILSLSLASYPHITRQLQDKRNKYHSTWKIRRIDQFSLFTFWKNFMKIMKYQSS